MPIDPLLVLTGIGIWTAGALGAFGLVRAEIWQIRKERGAFHNDHRSDVGRLQSKAELELVTTMYKLSTLKSVYGRPAQESSGLPRLTARDRTLIGDELGTITKCLGEVAEPKQLYESTLKAYDARVDSLSDLSYRSIAVTFAMPAAGIAAYAFPSPADPGFVLIAILVLYFGLVGLLPLYRKFVNAGKEIEAGRTRLTSLSDEKIYGLGPEPAAASPGQLGDRDLAGPPPGASGGVATPALPPGAPPASLEQQLSTDPANVPRRPDSENSTPSS